MHFRLSIIIILLLLYSCNIKQNSLSYSNAIKDTPFLTMQRTACYGTCPQYTITIYNSGLFKYEGKMFVEKQGCFYTIIQNKDIASIKSKLLEIDFFSFEKEYNSPITDIPSVILTVNTKKGQHSVINRFNGPESLNRFQNLMDSISDSFSTWYSCQDLE